MISILTYFILEEKRIGIRIGQYESSQQISCGFSKTKIRHFLSISNIYVLFIYSAFSRKQIVFLLFIYFYWSLLVIIGKTNNWHLCVPKNHFQCVTLTTPFMSHFIWLMIFIACSRSSTLLCAYAECLKSRIFASFITPVILFILIVIHNYDSFMWLIFMTQLSGIVSTIISCCLKLNHGLFDATKRSYGLR